MECYMLHPSEAPRRLQIASNFSKIDPRRPKDNLLALKTAPRRPQDGPKTPPGGLLEPLWRPLDAPSALRSPHDAPRPRFWSLQTSILEPLDLDFGASEPRFWRFSTSKLRNFRPISDAGYVYIFIYIYIYIYIHMGLPFIWVYHQYGVTIHMGLPFTWDYHSYESLARA